MFTVLRMLARYVVKPILAPGVPFWLQRQIATRVGTFVKTPKAVQMQTMHLAGIRTLQITPDQRKGQRVVLYLHGGGFVVGGFGSHRKLAGWVAAATRAAVFLPDYRLAPENPYPAARDDVLASYKALLEAGHQAANILIAGDSAGGGLSLSLLLAIRDAGLPQPAAAVLLSPWVDLSLTNPTIDAIAERDDLLTRAWLTLGADCYAGKTNRTDPGCSPIQAELNALPPILLQVGSDEVLLGDSVALNEKATAAGVDVRFQKYADAGHVFQLHAGRLKAANSALDAIAEFADEQFSLSQ